MKIKALATTLIILAGLGFASQADALFGSGKDKLKDDCAAKCSPSKMKCDKDTMKWCANNCYKAGSDRQDVAQLAMNLCAVEETIRSSVTPGSATIKSPTALKQLFTGMDTEEGKQMQMFDQVVLRFDANPELCKDYLYPLASYALNNSIPYSVDKITTLFKTCEANGKLDAALQAMTLEQRQEIKQLAGASFKYRQNIEKLLPATEAPAAPLSRAGGRPRR